MRYAAIDIGSNAVRMLFEEVYQTSDGPVFKKLSLVRLPVRLGDDAFLNGRISFKKENDLVNMARAFKNLCCVFDIDEYKATATSAMRTSDNGRQIIKHIKKEVGVTIDIIPGEIEAEILYDSIFNTGKLSNKTSYMFIDVGGGSTEVNFYCNDKRMDWQSFKLGTIRLKENLVPESEWDRFREYIKNKAAKYNPEFAVGTGGNINALYKRCGLKNWEMFSRKDLKNEVKFLSGFTPEELVYDMQFKRDRADVVVHAGNIYLEAMKKAKIDEMIVPKVGLADGLIRRMYFDSLDKKIK